MSVFLSTEQSFASTDERTFRCPWECLQHSDCILFGCADSGVLQGSMALRATNGQLSTSHPSNK